MHHCSSGLWDGGGRGLGSHAPNGAVQGDVGWKLQEDRQMKCVIKLVLGISWNLTTDHHLKSVGPSDRSSELIVSYDIYM